MTEVAFPPAPVAVRRKLEPLADATDAQLRKAARDFETVYLTEMLSKMGVSREPETFGGGFGAEAFQSLLNEAYAERIVGGGGTGIADQVYRQLRKGIAP